MSDDVLPDGTCRYCQCVRPGQHLDGCIWVAMNQHPSLNVYRGTAPEDVLIAGWWHRMDADGDLERIFPAGSRTMSELFRLVASPGKDLLYAFDAQGLWFAFWAERLLSAACIGFWVRADHRKSKTSAWHFLMAADMLLRLAPVIIGVTKQRDLVPIHRKFGYTVVGEIPDMYDGQAAIVMALTRPALFAAIQRLRHTNPNDPVRPRRAAVEA